MAHVHATGPESSSIQSLSSNSNEPISALVDIECISRWGLWALVVWSVFLFPGTLTHQPDTRTDFAGFAHYVTTTEFLVSHIVTSIIGGAIGVLGLFALFTFLALRIRSRLAAAGLCMAVVGNVMITAIFGMAAFAQPAVGRLYLAGHPEDAMATYSDMYGAPLSITAAVGLPLLVVGVICIGVAVARSRILPRWAGIGMAVGIVTFAVVGFILADFVQSIGAVVLIASSVWIAVSPTHLAPFSVLPGGDLSA
jgi:hypothetical protein